MEACVARNSLMVGRMESCNPRKLPLTTLVFATLQCGRPAPVSLRRPSIPSTPLPCTNAASENAADSLCYAGGVDRGLREVLRATTWVSSYLRSHWQPVLAAAIALAWSSGCSGRGDDVHDGGSEGGGTPNTDGQTCMGTPTYASCSACGTTDCARCMGCSLSTGDSHCSGVPAYSSCAACGSANDCNACGGCTGSCAGMLFYSDCPGCGMNLGCDSCPGCTASGGGCSGLPTYSTCGACGNFYDCATQCSGCTVSPTGSCIAAANLDRSCSALTSATADHRANCESVGCTWTSSDASVGGTCTGTATSCDAWKDVTTCDAHYACGWSALASCVGTLTPCGQFPTEPTCRAQTGCTWSGSCAGMPTPCFQFASTAACASQKGCLWSCVGTSTPCSQLTSEARCANQPGCIWSAPGVACTGTLTACAQLTASSCSSQAGCTLQ